MSEPTILDLVLGTVLMFALVTFGAAMVICRHRIDAWALDRERREGRAKEYFQIIPPASIMMEDWRFLARIRDRAGYILAVVLLYFIARAVWNSIA